MPLHTFEWPYITNKTPAVKDGMSISRDGTLYTIKMLRNGLCRNAVPLHSVLYFNHCTVFCDNYIG